MLSGAAWTAYKLTSMHYESIIAADQHAQDVALQASQDKAIADLKTQQAATQAAEKQYADLKTTYDGLSGKLADGVRAYAELRRGLVSATSTAAALADAASQGASRDSELAKLSGQAAQSCLDDAAALTGLQAWAAANAPKF
jgi:hypothetical protein